MDHVTLILSGLLTLAMVIVIAPNIMAINRGKALHNIAIWLANFLALGLIYKTVGPGSSNQMFSLPEAFAPKPTGLLPDQNKPNATPQAPAPEQVPAPA